MPSPTTHPGHKSFFQFLLSVPFLPTACCVSCLTKTGILPQDSTIVTWLLLLGLHILSLPWLATVWTWPLDSRRVRSWRLNEVYFLQTRNGGERLVPRSPTGSCSVSKPTPLIREVLEAMWGESTQPTILFPETGNSHPEIMVPLWGQKVLDVSTCLLQATAERVRNGDLAHMMHYFFFLDIYNWDQELQATHCGAWKWVLNAQEEAENGRLCRGKNKANEVEGESTGSSWGGLGEGLPWLFLPLQILVIVPEGAQQHLLSSVLHPPNKFTLFV